MNVSGDGGYALLVADIVKAWAAAKRLQATELLRMLLNFVFLAGPGEWTRFFASRTSDALF